MIKKIMLCSIRFYRIVLSPYKGRCHCRFYPTCSQYALEAIEKYGAWKGGKMALFRKIEVIGGKPWSLFF